MTNNVFLMGGKLPMSGGLILASGASSPTGGYDGALAINSSGLITNGGGTPIMLRGGNIAGLQDQEIVDGNLFSYTGVWGNQGGVVGGAPQWHFLSSQKLNLVRLNINSQSFANINSQSLVWGGSLGASSWSGVNVPGDPAGHYIANLLQTILQARAFSMYIMLELHMSAPQLVVGGVSQYVTANDQPPFMSGDMGQSFWTSSNPTIGLPAWLATNFGSAAFNAANGFNSGAQGAHYNALYGGASGFQDIIFELFNEPYFDQLGAANGFTLTTQAGTFGNTAWRANNAGSNYTTTNGGTPPNTPIGTFGQAGAEFIYCFGGFCNCYTQQSYQTGPPGMGVPPQFTSSTGRANSIQVQWSVGGYQQCLTAIRGFNMKNIVCVNGGGFAKGLRTLPYYMPDDTLSPPQIAMGYHSYNGVEPAPPGTYPVALDASGSATLTDCNAIMGGTLTHLANPVPIIHSETGDSCGTGFTETFMQFLTTNFIDDATLGSAHIAPWIVNDAKAFGTTATTLHWSNIMASPSYTITGSISGTTLTVSATTAAINVGDVLLTGMSSSINQEGTYIDAQLTGSAGSTGTYRLTNCLGTNPTGGSSFTAAALAPMAGQGVAYYNWTRNHA